VIDYWLDIAVSAPAYSGLVETLTYRHDTPLLPGALVRVPLGRREVLGVVWRCGTEAPASNIVARAVPVVAVLDLPPLTNDWRGLIAFAAHYYQRALGELALAALPPQLRALGGAQLARRLESIPRAIIEISPDIAPVLTEDQAGALQALAQDDGRPALLFGATGSGKTEVYLRAVQDELIRDPDAQALVLVPEINLTPQLLARFAARFVGLGSGAVVALHSGLTPARRLSAWLAAHLGRARILLGTRVAALASLPRLRLIVVDEEHEASYKQQEGARYSARDLAVYRACAAGIPVILGSATPSLESWRASTPKAEGGPGRYRRIVMPRRIGVPRCAPATHGALPPEGAPAALGRPGGGGMMMPPRSATASMPETAAASTPVPDTGLPRVRLLDMTRQPRGALIAPPLLAAIATRVARGEQALLLLNRRGYAPVLYCRDCGWKSECPYCSAYRVFHKLDRTLRCHHCGLTERVPRVCPVCGNADLMPIGRGTERLEEHLAELLIEARRPNGEPARILRIDADATRGAGELEALLAAVHRGEADVLVGTQMIAKGHDFRHVTLVAAINPDGLLYSSDFRAPERLFALLMQAAGRAGRDADAAQGSQMWVQTASPSHPLFTALVAHDYPAFAARQLAERAEAGLPPFSHLAMLRADARGTEGQAVAQAFLAAAREWADAQAARSAPTPDSAAHGGMGTSGTSALPSPEIWRQVTWYAPVPLPVARVANVERAQLLLESRSRPALQAVLAACGALLHHLHADKAHRTIVRWAIDVDPLTV
jgi:primosomal protein N' (replication factor Y)